MSSFASKYPAFAALLAFIAGIAKALAVPGETMLQKLTGMVTGAYSIIGAAVSCLSQVGSLGAEIAAIKASPSDIESAVEVLVTDLAFTSKKAQAIINAAFPFGEGIVALIPQGKALVSAIES